MQSPDDEIGGATASREPRPVGRVVGRGAECAILDFAAGLCSSGGGFRPRPSPRSGARFNGRGRSSSELPLRPAALIRPKYFFHHRRTDSACSRGPVGLKTAARAEPVRPLVSSPQAATTRPAADLGTGLRDGARPACSHRTPGLFHRNHVRRLTPDMALWPDGFAQPSEKCAAAMSTRYLSGVRHRTWPCLAATWLGRRRTGGSSAGRACSRLPRRGSGSSRRTCRGAVAARGSARSASGARRGDLLCERRPGLERRAATGHAIDAGVEERVLVSARRGSSRCSTLRGSRRAFGNVASAPSTVVEWRHRAHLAGAVAAGLGDRRLHGVVRGASGAVGAHEPGLPAVEVRLVLETEEEHELDGRVAGDVAKERGVDRGLSGLGRRRDALGRRSTPAAPPATTATCQPTSSSFTRKPCSNVFWPVPPKASQKACLIRSRFVTPAFGQT